VRPCAGTSQEPAVAASIRRLTRSGRRSDDIKFSSQWRTVDVRIGCVNGGAAGLGRPPQ